MNSDLKLEQLPRILPDFPYFPNDFTAISKDLTHAEDGKLLLDTTHQRLIYALFGAYVTAPRVEHYYTLLEWRESDFLSNLRKGGGKGFKIGFYIDKQDPHFNDLSLREIIHSHTISTKHGLSVQSVASNSDLQCMWYFKLNRIVVVAPFATPSVFVVQATQLPEDYRQWDDAFDQFNRLFGESGLTYDKAMAKLLDLSPQLGIEVFVGNIGDKDLLRP